MSKRLFDETICIGSELKEKLEELRKLGKHIFGVRVGRTNGEWIIEHMTPRPSESDLFLYQDKCQSNQTIGSS